MKNILYEDDQILVVCKPSGIATQTARVGQQDMVSELKNYLAKKETLRTGQEPYLGVVHRLDQPVSGLLVFAKTRSASAALSHQISTGQMQKYYYAIVLGKPAQSQDVLVNYLYKDGHNNRSYVVKEDFPEAKKAVLEYRTVKTLIALEENCEATLLEIKLMTGRHHQIRVQLANADIPILGDSKYGSMRSKDFNKDSSLRSLALCAYKLRFEHPLTGEELTFERNPEDEIFEAFLS